MIGIGKHRQSRSARSSWVLLGLNILLAGPSLSQGYGAEIEYGPEGLSEELIAFVASNGVLREVKADGGYATFGELANAFCSNPAPGYSTLVEKVLADQGATLDGIGAGATFRLPECFPAAKLDPVIAVYPSEGFEALLARYWEPATASAQFSIDQPFEHSLSVDIAQYQNLYTSAQALGDAPESGWQAAEIYRKYGLADDDVAAIELGGLGADNSVMLMARSSSLLDLCPTCEVEFMHSENVGRNVQTFVQGDGNDWDIASPGRGVSLPGGYFIETDGGIGSTGVIRMYEPSTTVTFNVDPNLNEGIARNLAGQNILDFAGQTLSLVPDPDPSGSIETGNSIAAAIAALNSGRNSEGDFAVGEYINFVAPKKKKLQIGLRAPFQIDVQALADAGADDGALFQPNSANPSPLGIPDGVKIFDLVRHYSTVADADGTLCGTSPHELIDHDQFLSRLGLSLKIRDELGTTARGTGLAVWDIGIPEEFGGFVNGLPFDLIAPEFAEKAAFSAEELARFADSHGVSVAAVAAGMGILQEVRQSGQDVVLETILNSIFRLKDGNRVFRMDEELSRLTNAEVQIVNLSVGRKGKMSAFELALERNTKKLFVLAAGNNGIGTGTKGEDIVEAELYPQSLRAPENGGFQNMLVVGALNASGDDLAVYSNFNNEVVELAAQGCFTALPVFDDAMTDKIGNVKRIGTSYAAPQVSFIAALLRELIPTRTFRGDPQLIKSRLLATAKVVRKLEQEGKVKSGYVLDPLAAISPFHTIVRTTSASGEPVELLTAFELVNRDASQMCNGLTQGEGWTLLRIRKKTNGAFQAIFRDANNKLKPKDCQPFSHGKFFFAKASDLEPEFVDHLEDARNLNTGSLREIIFSDPVFLKGRNTQ